MIAVLVEMMGVEVERRGERERKRVEGSEGEVEKRKR